MDIGRSAWNASAAYLYLIGLDNVSLAWEYLRRNPSYQSSWRVATQRPDAAAAGRWGLRSYEDPRRDSRVADPQWVPLPPSSVQLTRHVDGHEAAGFQFWAIPGRKSLVHDGLGIQLTARNPPRVARAILAPDIATDEPYQYSVPADRHVAHRCGAVNEFETIYQSRRSTQRKNLPVRPTRSALMHMRALQALDAARVGAAHRDIAIALFGEVAVRDQWTTDSELRAQVRYVIRRGQALSLRGYRALLSTDSS